MGELEAIGAVYRREKAAGVAACLLRQPDCSARTWPAPSATAPRPRRRRSGCGWSSRPGSGRPGPCRPNGRDGARDVPWTSPATTRREPVGAARAGRAASSGSAGRRGLPAHPQPARSPSRPRGNRGLEVVACRDVDRDAGDEAETVRATSTRRTLGRASRVEELPSCRPGLTGEARGQLDGAAPRAPRRCARPLSRARRARADRLEAALAEARRPWLARVLEGLRRKGS